jgi:KUP system potassium uptake protein
MTQSHTPPSERGPRPASSFVDEAELDIAEFLRDEEDDPIALPKTQSYRALVIGAIGVVYGDIGTSPIYAFREALRPVLATGGPTRPEVLGLLSLLIWTLILIVTAKYVLFLLRLDNRGEGGVLALYTMVRLAIGQRSVPVLGLAILGAALFFGDAAITPAISVLSAVEGAELVLPSLTNWVVPITIGILFGLFMLQRQGTARIAGTFGPITALWFLTLAGLGLWNIALAPDVLAAFNPAWGLAFLLDHQGLAFVVLGAVFLAVTGAEALYADLGHFGRGPIMTAWFLLVFPALVLNYLGQGALVLTHPELAENPFYSLAPASLLPVLVVLATIATVIAAQAVISGAFSMARAAIQLGLLPRMTIRHTSADQSGQIYIGAVNWILLFGVVWLVISFETSESLAAAYGIAVTGTMVITTLLAGLYLSRSHLLSTPLAVVVVLPVLVIELVFLTSNLAKVLDGGFVPLMIAAVLGLAMWSWWSGTQSILAKAHKQLVPLASFVKSMAHSSVHIVPGTAFFLSPDPDVVPSALLHNLKHNRILHEQTVIVTIETLRVPVAAPEERVQLDQLDDRFTRLTLRFGFMETPNVSRAMSQARRAGLRFDVMKSSFFLGRRRPVVAGPFGGKRLLDRCYALLTRFSADPTDFYHLPRDRVVELGERVAL